MHESELWFKHMQNGWGFHQCFILRIKPVLSPPFFQCHAREVRHVVHGSPGGKWGEVECSWLRVELKGMEEAQRSDEDGGELRSFSAR